MKQLLLSIAIPTYNRAKPLEAQLSSLHKQLSQSLFSSSIEVVVVDNCSDDSTQDLIKDYSAKEKEYTFSSYKNTKNIGSDLNFGQAIIRSQGICPEILLSLAQNLGLILYFLYSYSLKKYILFLWQSNP